MDFRNSYYKKEKQLRIESFVPFSSCLLPIQNVCNASMGTVYGICIQCIPYATQFSWLSWPIITEIFCCVNNFKD